MLQPKSWSVDWAGRPLTVETGRFALQALASCTVRYADTMVMASVVKSDKTRDSIDYFPLMVDFEEKLYAAGKIKGSRFIKREGRPSDEAILVGRLIDRAIRPLFDSRLRNDIQVVITPFSVDGENDAAITGLVAASVALAISSIPWEGPIAAARVGLDEAGGFVINPTNSDLEKNAKLDLVVAGTPDKLVMVEAGASEVADGEMYRAIRFGADSLAPVISLIEKIAKEIGQTKTVVEEPDQDSPLVKAKIALGDFVSSSADNLIFSTKRAGRKERVGLLGELKKVGHDHLVSLGFEESIISSALESIKDLLSLEVSKRILNKKERLDGRGLDEIRPLETAIDLIPRVHGSAMFMRGDTQVLSVVTLGAPGDVQTLDTMEEDGKKRYMHHYNDAPYTYNEVGPLRGPGRRSIGHGALAERALEPVLPAEIDFPYAIRVVSEVLGSNGSSSMASTCGSTLSLMAAGVPIKKPVAGIAMGLASDSSGRYEVLTDLQDVEDGDGGMDFKIAGTRDGITAIQMDTKTSGLSWEIVEKTIAKASEARKTILDKMLATIATPRADLSPFAPRIETIQINPEKIREVIGPGGKVINKIIDETGVQIDIEQDGRVMITSNNGEMMQKAKNIIIGLTKDPMAGEVYDGSVVRLEDFGAFVQILPNKDGLVHVSEIAWERTGRPSDVLKIGDVVKVVVKEIDNLGRVNLSMRALLPKPEGYVEQVREDRGPRNGPPRQQFGARPPRRGQV